MSTGTESSSFRACRMILGRCLAWTLIGLLHLAVVSAGAAELYQKPDRVVSRWSTFENPGGVKGQGGMANRGAKGSFYRSLAAGESMELLDVEGSGVISRMWFTLHERTPVMLRALKLEIFWDGAKTPLGRSPRR